MKGQATAPKAQGSAACAESTTLTHRETTVKGLDLEAHKGEDAGAR